MPFGLDFQIRFAKLCFAASFYLLLKGENLPMKISNFLFVFYFII